MKDSLESSADERTGNAGIGGARIGRAMQTGTTCVGVLRMAHEGLQRLYLASNAWSDMPRNTIASTKLTMAGIKVQQKRR